MPDTKAIPLAVLQVIPSLDAGGVERTTIDVTRAIVAAGGRAVVATRGGRKESEVLEAGGELIHLPVHSKNPATMVLNVPRLVEVIRTRNINIVHARSRACAWSALGAARLTGHPFVTTFAGIYNEGFPGKRFYNSIMARGDAVIANSRFTADHVARNYRRSSARVFAIPRGIDIVAFDADKITPARLQTLRAQWALPAQRPVVLLPGRLTRWKGQLVLIDAAARLRAQGRDVVFVLAGDDQGRDGYVDELRRAIEQHGLKDRVLITGDCSDMPAAYALADVIVSASTDPEAFGRVAVEGQAMGKVVVATDHGGARETIAAGATGILVPPGDSAALAEALAHALSMTTEARAAMGARARSNARAVYSVDAMGAATLAVYKSLLAPRG